MQPNQIKTMKASLILFLLTSSASAFVPRHIPSRGLTTSQTFMTIVSPFDESGGDEAVATQEAASIGEGPFELTWDNVEMVLDEMRPYLIQDGGNVVIQEIDGPVVKLELQVRRDKVLK